jgi:flagellar basal-body rod protein FlgB
MESISAQLLLRNLDGLSLRASVIAQNIANANSPDYRPLSVLFEDTLQAAAQKGLVAIASAMPRIESSNSGVIDTPVRIDLELASMATTSGRYAAIAEIMNRELQIDAVAVSGSR